MGTPIPAQSAKEAFDERMHDMVEQLESTDAFFFYKIVSRSCATEVLQGAFAYALEFPRNFIKQHGRKFDKDVTFGMKDIKRTWPIRLTLRASRQSKPRVFAYGDGGWKTFVMHNRIKVGDVLIFTLTSFSKFQVFIGRAPEEDDSDDDGNMDNDDAAKWSTNPSPRGNADQVPESSTGSEQAPHCSNFLVTISSRRSSLAVPSRFWEVHGNMLESDELQLKGPNETIYKVKANRTYDEEDSEKFTVCLDSGWEAFRRAHKLRVGDILEFFLVESSCFTVVFLERTQKYYFG